MEMDVAKGECVYVALSELVEEGHHKSSSRRTGVLLCNELRHPMHVHRLRVRERIYMVLLAQEELASSEKEALLDSVKKDVRSSRQKSDALTSCSDSESSVTRLKLWCRPPILSTHNLQVSRPL